MIRFVIKIGNQYYSGVRRGPEYTLDINDAETFEEYEDIENLLNSDVCKWIGEDIKEKMQNLGVPLVIETIIPLGFL